MNELWENFLLGLLIGFTIALVMFNMADAQEKILRVAVLDTGLNINDERFKGVLCPSGHQDYTQTGLDDTDGHGTHVAGLIKQYAGPKGYCLVILKYYNEKASGKSNEENELAALREAYNQHVDIVNISGGGTVFEESEYLIVSRAYSMLVIGAVGNQGQQIKSYPGCLGLPNTRCVGSLDAQGHKAPFSNYGPWVNAWRIGVNVLSTLPSGQQGYLSGTSMSTAIESGMEIRRRLNALY